MIRAFIEELESQQEWPTLVVDHFEKRSTWFFGIPVSGTLSLHITARESDTPEETEAEYLTLVNERGAIATPELCEPLSEKKDGRMRLATPSFGMFYRNHRSDGRERAECHPERGQRQYRPVYHGYARHGVLPGYNI